MSTRRALLGSLVLLAATGITSGTSQRPTRPAPCPTAPEPDTTWARFAFAGLHLSLRLPADLRPKPYQALRGIDRRVRADDIPATPAETVELVAAWEIPKAASSEIRQVLLYTVRPDSLPRGRPCALPIAKQTGVVFRKVLSGGSGRSDEYWTEAYWPAFALAVHGTTLNAFAVALAILRSIEPVP